MVGINGEKITQFNLPEIVDEDTSSIHNPRDHGKGILQSFSFGNFESMDPFWEFI